MSTPPTETADHWWQRPGRRPGRELYHWHMLFHDQPAVQELVAMAQGRLAGLPNLDPVPIRWLHLTTYVLGFVDEVPEPAIEAMTAEARRLLRGIAPVPIRLGRVFYHPEAVVLVVEPLGVLNPVLEAVRAAATSAGCEGHTDTDPWIPHVSIAYSSSVEPAAPIVAALGWQLPTVEATVRSVSLVAQTQVERSWQWRPVIELPLAG